MTGLIIPLNFWLTGHPETIRFAATRPGSLIVGSLVSPVVFVGLAECNGLRLSILPSLFLIRNCFTRKRPVRHAAA